MYFYKPMMSYLEFWVYENMDIFLTNDHIWNYLNLNSHISQTNLDICI